MESVAEKNISRRCALCGLAAIFVLIQIPALKVYDIKLIEMVGLLAICFNIRTLTRGDWCLVVYFTLFFVLSLAMNPRHSFPDIQHANVFKHPYLITVARYAEYLSIIGFIILIRNYVRRFGHHRVVKTFIMTSIAVQGIIIIGYLLGAANLEIIEVAYLEDGFLRMKGFFVEGGPLGLFNAFLIIILILYCKPPKAYLLSAFFLVFIVLGKSKAGLTTLAAWSCMVLLFKGERFIHKKHLLLLLRFTAIGGFIAIFFLLSSVYIVDLADRDGLMEIIDEDPNDFWISGGRVPGYFILKQMITAHPVLGIGMGNYPLLRNADRYRDFMPATTLWDIHGYGGIVEILNQFGILGLVLFMVMMAAIFRPLERNGALLLAFLIPFAFGLSLHFHYPWMILGMLHYAAESTTAPREAGAAQV